MKFEDSLQRVLWEAHQISFRVLPSTVYTVKKMSYFSNLTGVRTSHAGDCSAGIPCFHFGRAQKQKWNPVIE